ncbi:16S rRNA (guanine(966)-N(2))-methyltransferase RsmD [Acidisoma cladoniae]|jgi:16S rRNA (guanine966-N2)-methyltransferase|uniref:16S rRNA (guanine(966)-N(2))-methyltransferase RsmD n=1 Tax=Acidisoma cladoniae TaxID=3040935 RepID=UPI00254E636C|nr:16S rRNA (guanine(966)-N(2))-methyltransferase RsmD [Acidisoma sp. PAMC 29798]
MRIIAGRFKGRRLTAPAGDATRPTSDRARQALFDILLHAPWAEDVIEGAVVLDAFAGTGALGLEALSRGAAMAHFIENARPSISALRDNVTACGAVEISRVIPADARKPPKGVPCGLVFLDPPYGLDLVPTALAALSAAGWIAPAALIVAEIGAGDTVPTEAPLLADRRLGAARICVWRVDATS